MSAMKPSTVSRPPASEPPSTDTGETFFKTPNAPPGRHFQQVKMPGVAKGPILPEWLRTYFRNRFRRKHTAATRQ
jgi:hypothetical protein